MIKLLLIFLFLSTTLMAKNYKILEVREHTLLIEKNDWAVGSSGLLIHNVNTQHSTVSSRVEVISHEKNSTTIKFINFDDLKQEALPTLNTKISTNDTVQLGWLHNRVLVIAPTQNSYQLVQKGQQDKTFINSDLFALHLSKEGHPTPLKEDLQSFCRNYDIGIIEFVIADTVYQVDAYTFTVLETIEAKFPQTKQSLPFFSHVKDINADWWGAGSGTLSHYENYYLSLLGVKS